MRCKVRDMRLQTTIHPYWEYPTHIEFFSEKNSVADSPIRRRHHLVIHAWQVFWLISLYDAFPALWPVTIRCRRALWDSQQRELYGIYTRFPFNLAGNIRPREPMLLQRYKKLLFSNTYLNIFHLHLRLLWIYRALFTYPKLRHKHWL